jgi:serine/threonine protein kinase
MGFLPDERIATYRVERELGSTTTGVLYQAVHLVLPRRAVIKVAHAARGQQFAIQLLREACLLEALSHPGVPQVYESGLLEDRRPWFAAEIIEGMTLAERMLHGSLPSSDVATLIRDLASILEHAHKRGVVHRALRPDRVVITRKRPEISVALPDWSEARAHDSTGEAAGMPSRNSRPYLAPEVARGEVADDRADVYSLGVLAYHALTGGFPRGTETQPYIATVDRCPEAPRELAMLIDQMLSADRFDRPTCAEIRSDLEWLANALSIELVLDDGMTTASPGMRMRKPRWTPAIEPVMTEEPSDSSTVSGEIIIIEVDD